MSPTEKKVLQTFLDFWEVWALRKNQTATIDDIQLYFDENVTAIGSGLHEAGRDTEGVIKNFYDDFDELTAPVNLDFYYTDVKMISSNVGLVEAEAKASIVTNQNDKLDFHLRFSTLFVEKAGKWFLSHNHVSIPYEGQDIGEAYPINALRAKNNQLEHLVRERTKELEEKTIQLQSEKENSERLLYNILPKSIAQELIATGKTNPARHDEVSVLFTDFKEFTNIVATIPAKALIMELNDIFRAFDDIVDSFGIEKIQTVGDAYLAACGLPTEDPDHAIKCVKAAKEMIKFLEERNTNSMIKWKTRIGIHSGPITAGVVGKKKFGYDIFGDTVNVAARIETAGEEMKINVSAYTYYLIREDFACEYRGKIDAKGKGHLDMYFVE
ncbi:MAG: adenylate/guanylate cyclase domain-containing protein [Bacteroidota bacterium]